MVILPDMPIETTLRKITEATDEAADVENRISALVSQARMQGVPWRAIATALGTTASNAHRKYS